MIDSDTKHHYFKIHFFNGSIHRKVIYADGIYYKSRIGLRWSRGSMSGGFKPSAGIICIKQKQTKASIDASGKDGVEETRMRV